MSDDGGMRSMTAEVVVGRLSIPEQVTVSPDGGDIVYTLRVNDLDLDRSVSELWVIQEGRPPRRLVGDSPCTSPSISADGSRVAFLREDEQVPQLWLLPMDGGVPERVTSLPLGAGHPVWNPDGGSIAFVAPVSAHEPDATNDGVKAPIVVSRLGHREDGQPIRARVRRHIHVLELETLDVTQLTSGDWDAGQPSWSPDGSSLVFSAGASPDSDIALTSSVFVVSPAAGKAPVVVGPQHGVMGAVTWHPDGKHVVVVGTVGPVNGPMGLLKISLDDGSVVDLAAPLERNVMPGAPAYPGAAPQFTSRSTVVFCVRDRGYTELYEVDTSGGAPWPLPTIAGSNVRGAAVAPDADRAIVIVDAPGSFAELATIELGKDSTADTVSYLTAHNPTAEDVGFFVREARDFAISDGVTVSGWLLRSPDTQGPAPLLVDIHGGPHNAWNGALDESHLYHQELARRGWIIVIVNPRGSDGYGPSFFNAIDGAWGMGDAADILEPIEALVAEGIADPHRLAVAGYSYGGYLTCYLTSRDDRFAAAVAGGTISDMTSMVGTSSEGRFLHFELDAEPWRDRARFSTVSPYDAVERVTTPTLLLHGEHDTVCPVGQAEQWFHALRVRDVPTSLVVYPGGSHLFPLDGPPSHRVDYGARIVAWLERFTSGAEGRG